jgi:hypothetical protein
MAITKIGKGRIDHADGSLIVTGSPAAPGASGLPPVPGVPGDESFDGGSPLPGVPLDGPGPPVPGGSPARTGSGGLLGLLVDGSLGGVPPPPPPSVVGFPVPPGWPPSP